MLGCNSIGIGNNKRAQVRQDKVFIRKDITWLTVQYQEKDLAKTFGAKWNNDKKKWFAPAGIDLTHLKKWCSEDIQEQMDTPNEHPVIEEPAEKGIALSALLITIKGAVESVTTGALWVRAEIIAIKKYHWGWIYDLGEMANGKVIAKISAKAWSSNVEQMQEKCNAANVQITSGIQALILVKAQFDLQYGAQLNIIDMDTDFILGNLQRKKQEIIKQLKVEGIISQNRDRLQPVDFAQVVVISPLGSAGQGDFRKEADHLQHLGLCNFHYIYATFQGKNSSHSLQESFNDALEIVHNTPTEAIVIIRGGGAATDLAWLDDMGMARLICTSPVPVLTGLGHKQDRSVLDSVSNQSFDTPSKVSIHIRDSILNNGRQTLQALEQILNIATDFFRRASANAIESHQSISIQSHNLIQTHKLKINDSVSTIHDQSQALIRHSQEKQIILWDSIKAGCKVLNRQTQTSLFSTWANIRFDVNNICDRVNTQIKSISFLPEARLLINNARRQSQEQLRLVLAREPKSILKHGFTITRSPSDLIIRSAADAIENTELIIEFHDGKIKVKNPRPFPSNGESNE